MSHTLTREPLQTALSFIEGHRIEPQPPADPRTQPLAYLYSHWDGYPAKPEEGHYDEQTQTWVFPPGSITAGVATNTNTSCYQGSDKCRDDTCS
ncbi:hypothetical protein Acsp04_65380 [Actinomadura sp. NBRC 104425]|uniref:hypothetical protein n=1 Tax=Actinomadura sp. NBRC 104425 TaxID=3032204 RepID=UPI0024A06C8B|nr:hypothetical protein [Actinomadura sp. NBRC 104425]GLZ16303.1 hypothetical protein Acsp04_65380 [Actinomadura sp. NBRC 104425]